MRLRQEHIDAASDTLKRVTENKLRLPEHEIAAWFINLRDGPQFFIGSPANLWGNKVQPLYLTPAYVGQEPVAWKSAGLITTDRSIYRKDIRWLPLYLAR